MLQVVDAGGQAALVAPTEVLAAQHERSLRRMLGHLSSDGTLMSPHRARPSGSHCSRAQCLPRRGSRPCWTSPRELPVW
ncbi:hypothetical protein [Nesterenkonia pannonica]|uniref:hypothetical protein n=1 Tax=Nesterenkonia pannonica TaxID=1548602 RepID=UPI00216426FE|nr:hypothetical protein [Nesterenkonia pannonica]